MMNWTSPSECLAAIKESIGSWWEEGILPAPFRAASPSRQWILSCEFCEYVGWQKLGLCPEFSFVLVVPPKKTYINKRLSYQM